jgi:hypothetical protein
VPPGRALAPAQVRALGQALADAIAHRADQVADAGQVRGYRQLAAVVAGALPEITGEER